MLLPATSGLHARTQFAGQWIGRKTVRNDAQGDGEYDRYRKKSATFDTLVQDDNGEYDTGQTTRSEPTQEQFAGGRLTGTGQGEEHW